MADFLPVFKSGQTPSYPASAAVTGGRLLMVSGSQTVAHTSGDVATWIGTAGFDAAIGDQVTIHRGGVQRLVASGAIAVGDRVGPASAGRVATASTNKVGTAITAAADGALASIAMDR